LRPLGKNLRFWPGQYIQLGSRSENISPRCFSIGNIPNSDGEIVLYITRIAGSSTSEWIHDKLESGATVEVSGPYGQFVGDPSVDTPVLCLAAGSGLAPIMSLAAAALQRGGFKRPATVFFSGKTKTDLFELGLFRYLETKFRNFRFHYTLTREKNEGGYEGRIPALLKEKFPDLSNHSIYIAGSVGFVEACQKEVESLGAKKDLIHTEGFVSQDIPK
jgi:CDP-4-dehydro-6-deoxyglucose reductase